jgi:serine/threonine protein phosphatase PrpC
LSESDLEWHLSTLAEEPPNPDYTAKLLVDAALINGSKDNATALVLRVLSLQSD